jgi:hypothetical protein
MTEEQLNNPDTVNASALDVISCGLGAAVLLFLVLSVVRADTRTSASTEEFIEILISLSGTSDALIVPVLQPPGASKPIVVPLLAIDRVTGRFRPDSAKLGVDPDQMSKLLEAAQEYQMLGFTIAGDYRVTEYKSGKKEFRVNILVPAPGEWKVSCRYFNADSTARVPRVGDPPIHTELVVKTRKDTKEFAGTIGFAQQTNPIKITVPPNRR